MWQLKSSLYTCRHIWILYSPHWNKGIWNIINYRDLIFVFHTWNVDRVNAMSVDKTNFIRFSKYVYDYSVGLCHVTSGVHDHMGCWSENSRFTPMLPLHCTLASTKYMDVRVTELSSVTKSLHSPCYTAGRRTPWPVYEGDSAACLPFHRYDVPETWRSDSGPSGACVPLLLPKTMH